MGVATRLPQHLADDIVREYADILRVGRLRVGGEEITWSTGGAMEAQLEAFGTAVIAALRENPDVADLCEDVLNRSIYWVCKLVSINYALVEVLDYVRHHVGPMTSIRTCDSDGKSLVDYSVEIGADKNLKVAISWRGKGNIVQSQPQKARPKVRGTLSLLETEFPLPPAFGFQPEYRVHAKFSSKTTTERLMKKFVCRDKRHRLSPKSILLQEPLCMPFRHGKSKGAACTASTASPACSPSSATTTATGSSVSSGEPLKKTHTCRSDVPLAPRLPPPPISSTDDEDDEPLRLAPRTFRANSVRHVVRSV